MIHRFLTWLASRFNPVLWSQRDAIRLARVVFELNTAQYHCYPALTGGCLYKDGKRKDCDILFYPDNCNGKHYTVDKRGLLPKLEKAGFTLVTDHGYCVKAKWQGRDVDLFFVGHTWRTGKPINITRGPEYR